MKDIQRAVLMGVLVASSATLYAQSSSGTSVGTVSDNTGGVVSGAAVTLTNVATGDTRTAKTNDQGGFQFVNVQPGSYKIDVQLTGFKHFTVSNVIIQVGNSTLTDAKLDIGSVSETVQVTSQTAQLETQQATIGQVVEGRAVEEMPLNGRQIFNLVEVAPGVVPLQNVNPADAATGARGGFAGGNYMIAGGIPNAGVQFVDGGSINSGYINSLAFVPSQDSIQEFNVQGNNISPEYGGTENGVTSLVTKSGTNTIHGSVADYFRNTILNANTFFGNRAGLKRPVFQQNQYSATAGGPIKRDKLFFFLSYEGSRESIGATSTSTVPTLAQRAGQFSSAVTDPGSFDKATYSVFTPNPAGTTFAGNMIPANRIDPTALAELNFWPLPQTTATSNNYTATLLTHPFYSQYLGRVDWTISQKARFFARYLYQSATANGAPAFGLQQYAYFATKSGGTAHQAVMGYDYTFNPTTILNVRLAYLRLTSIQEPQCYPNCDISFTGWPSSQIAQMIPGPFIPRVMVTGLTQTGGAQVIPVHADDDAISGSMTKILGRHTLKFGGEFRRQPNNFGQDNQAYDEVFNFTSSYTGNAFASYLLGLPNQTTTLTAFYPAAMQRYAGAYLGDTFQITPRLTANLGVRWEYPGYWTERHNRQAVFLPNATNPLSVNGTPLKGDVALVATPAYPGRTPQYPKWDAFSPRVGFAYQLGSKNVIRGGFGLTWAENAIIQQNVQPYNSPVNSAFTILNPIISGTTTLPNNAFHNPFPQGIIQPVGRAANYNAAAILGQTVDVPVPSNSAASYIEQYNLDFQHDFGHQIVFDVAYVGSKANHLPAPGGSLDNGIGLNQLPNTYDICGTDKTQTQCGGHLLSDPVAGGNPFYGKIASGSLSGTTLAVGQLLRPYPQYQNLFNSASAQSYTQYNSLQMKVQKRFSAGGTMLIAYTWDDDHGTADSTTAFGATEPGQPQDYYNLAAERSQLTFNVPQLLVASYVYDLPVGKGKYFLGNTGPFVDRVIGGWSLDGITQYHSGYPVVIIAQNTSLSSNYGAGTPRPVVAAGCNTVNSSGSAASRVTGWFNTSCFSQPGLYAFGNEPRVDPTIRSQGIANWDFSLVKQTAITERIGLQFRTEVFNAFNRVQFGNPSGVCCATSTFGVVSTQLNQPRQMQFALKLTY